MKKGFILIIFILCIAFASAQDFPNYQDKYVNDFAHILDSSNVEKLHDLFQHVDQTTTAEVVFVSMASIEGNDLSQYATDLGQEWKVGKADKDNGVVILYVLDVNKIWVATGYGIEGILPDSKIGRLLDQYYVPARDNGEVNTGIVDFSTAIARLLEENKDEILSGEVHGDTSYVWLFIMLVVFIIVIRSIIGYGLSASNKRFWWAPIFTSGGRGFGGGGGGFGGGGFGGGGAGR
jgi:uncharacterized protein